MKKFTDARTDERTDGRTHDGHNAMTIARWPSASGANNNWHILRWYKWDLLVFCKQTPLQLAAIGTLRHVTATAQKCMPGALNYANEYAKGKISSFSKAQGQNLWVTSDTLSHAGLSCTAGLSLTNYP